MALTKEELKTNYPLPVYNYRVEIDGESIAFTEVSGLSLGFETSTYKESPVESGSPGPRFMYMPSQIQPVNITLKKGVIRGGSVGVLYGWIKDTRTNLIDKKDINIRLCDENGDPVVSWQVVNAFPTKLDAPTFDASNNDAAIESMELMADRVIIEEA